MTGIWASVGCG